MLGGANYTLSYINSGFLDCNKDTHLDNNGNLKYNYFTIKHAAMCGNIRAQRYLEVIQTLKKYNPRTVSGNSRPLFDNHLRMKLYWIKNDKIGQAAEIGTIALPRR